MTDERRGPAEEDDMLELLLERPELGDAIRDAHNGLDTPEGVRAEVIGGSIILSPSPQAQHQSVVKRVQKALLKVFDVDWMFENATIGVPIVDRYIPDLAIWPFEYIDHAEGWVFASEECLFVLEVTSPRQESRDYAKAAGYSRGNVPVYLLVDRKARECVLHTDPSPTGYRTTASTPFGDPVELPFGAVVDTSEF
jgi:Uma2 family endonuclease